MSDNATFKLEDLQDMVTFLENNNHQTPYYHAQKDELSKLSDEEFMLRLSKFRLGYSVDTGLYILDRWTKITNQNVKNELKK